MHVVVTGANRGIGKALADLYRGLGDQVTATSRDGAAGLVLDVTDLESQRNLAGQLGAEPVDLLVCNAGVYIDKGQDPRDGYPPEMWAETFAVNVTGVFLTVQHLLPLLRLSPRAKVAIISSQMGANSKATGGSYAYRASKAAALNLGKNLATDLRRDGIAVGIYHPGWVRTDMGGDTAEIGIDAAATCLAQRFDALTLDRTGCFETWDGREHPL